MSALQGMKVLMVMAHPDDEIIFGWPIFQDPTIEKKLLICSSDANNPERKWCKYRKDSLYELCEKMGVPVYCLDYDSGFYRTPTRRPPNMPRTEEGDAASPFRHMSDHISKLISNLEEGFDCVFTHNPYGEYGHLDHKLVFDLVLKTTRKDILYTDIFLATNWSKKYVLTDRINMLFYNNKILEDRQQDLELLESAKKIYQKRNGWTWSREIPSICSVYKL